VSPMSAIYPLHLQREIDRRWFQRSEQATSARAPLTMVDVLREAAALHHDDKEPRLMLRPQGAPAKNLRRSTKLE
jgi:hypothetical protein